MIMKSIYTDKTYKSPNRTSPRTSNVDVITPHCFVGQASIENGASWFMQPEAECSCNYLIGEDGRVALICPEEDRSWCTSNGAIDHRGITIECASGTTYPYSLHDVVWKKLILLCVDICERYGKTALLYLGTKEKTLSYKPKKNEMLLAEHRWFDNKECPGEYIHSRLGYLAEEVTKLLRGITAETQAEPKEDPKWYRVRIDWSKPKTQIGAYENLDVAKSICPPSYKVYDYMGNLVYENKASGTQAYEFEKLSDKETADKILSITTPLAMHYGLLPSVIAAQCILETGYLRTSKLLPYNNILGMKSSLLNNSWYGSTWDGKSEVAIPTIEFVDGVEKEIVDKFRVYPNIESCIEDICAFFSTLPKYVNSGILKAKDYTEQITIESNCGYATDPSYTTKVCNIIVKNDLARNDPNRSGNENKRTYHIVQIGYYDNLDLARERATVYLRNGIDCSIAPKNKGYRIQAGAFERKSNAETRRKDVQAIIDWLYETERIPDRVKAFTYEV